MLDTAYATRNTDGSLKSRIDEYLNIFSEYTTVKSSKNELNDSELRDLSGHEEDVEQAEKILANSVSRLIKTFSQDDIKQALKLGFMTEAEAWELSKSKEHAHKLEQANNKAKSRSRR